MTSDHQCGPAERQPLEKSANSWMWKPCLPGVMPEIFHAITHGASAVACEAPRWWWCEAPRWWWWCRGAAEGSGRGVCWIVLDRILCCPQSSLSGSPRSAICSSRGAVSREAMHPSSIRVRIWAWVPPRLRERHDARARRRTLGAAVARLARRRHGARRLGRRGRGQAP